MYDFHMVSTCADAQNVAAIAEFLNSVSYTSLNTIKKSRLLAVTHVNEIEYFPSQRQGVAHVVTIADRKEGWFSSGATGTTPTKQGQILF